MPTETINHATEATAPGALPQTIDHPENPAKEDIDGAWLLDEVTSFIGEYLECSEHQRTLMALWVLHTHCLSIAQVTPYLAIQSIEKQSGKTLCLKLLSLLVKDDALTTGFTASALSRRLDPNMSTILLDECQATIGTRARPKSPLLRAVLACGYEFGTGYTDATHERNLFAPKAFAGMGQLPEGLADRAISIVLKPLSPDSTISRFDDNSADEEGDTLRQLLDLWVQEHAKQLEELQPYDRQDFPPKLSPRQQDTVEPLLQLADAVGGDWPQKIRAALAEIFQEESDFELKESLQLLSDVRDCFAYHDYCERLSTALLLDWLHSLPPRPWDVDGPITARNFAHLLVPFDIHPRMQRIGKTSLARGYQLEDFIEYWEKHLGFDPAVVTDGDPSEIANNDAVCSTVTDSRANSEIAIDPRESVLSSVDAFTETSPRQEPIANSQKPLFRSQKPEASSVTHTSPSQIVNNDAVCHTVTDSRTNSAIGLNQPGSAAENFGVANC